jgi:mevalonate kinase
LGSGYGYGKVILFGEHFVVYGLPAIVSAIGSKTIANVQKLTFPGLQLIDDRQEVPGYKKDKKGEQDVSIQNILNYCKIDPKKYGIKVRFGGDLVAASGIGASAASCAALSRALNQEFGLGFDDEKINSSAFEGEKGYHGNPSGIDNTAATYGGLIWFERNLNDGPNIIEKMNMKDPVNIVVANTGLTTSTAKVVADVRKQKDKEPNKFEKIFSEYCDIVTKARKALIENQLDEIGDLMNANQNLLRKINVSSPELEKMIKIALDYGALGAKLTGTGRGGNMFALTPDKKLQEIISNIFEEYGYLVWKTTIGI